MTGKRGKTPYHEEVMSDRDATEPERTVQRRFRIAEVFASLVLLALIGLFDRWLVFVPNREESGSRIAAIEFAPIDLDRDRFRPMRLIAAWQLTSNDPRVGGVSALAVDRGEFLALSDSGALIRFAFPRARIGRAKIRELPDGPGSSRFKRNRDSEALVRDPSGRGWWVVFENRHQLWLYNGEFSRSLGHIALPSGGWWRNVGIEGAVIGRQNLLLLHEHGKRLFRFDGNSFAPFAIAGTWGRISDAASLGDGKFLLVERRLTSLGFKNALVVVNKVGGEYRAGRRFPLPLGPLDNVEGVAVELLPSGGTRVWLMTDDNFQPPMRTLLIALDLPRLVG